MTDARTLGHRDAILRRRDGWRELMGRSATERELSDYWYAFYHSDDQFEDELKRLVAEEVKTIKARSRQNMPA